MSGEKVEAGVSLMQNIREECEKSFTFPAKSPLLLGKQWEPGRLWDCENE